MNRYSRGVLYVLNIPDNIADLYRLPQNVLTRTKEYLHGDFPVRIDAPPLVSLFAYDNDTFVVQSFRDAPAMVGISVAGTGLDLRNLVSDRIIRTSGAAPGGTGEAHAGRAVFRVTIEPHSYEAFRIER